MKAQKKLLKLLKLIKKQFLMFKQKKKTTTSGAYRLL